MHTRHPSLRSLAATAAFALAVAACGGSTLPTAVPSIAIPSLPPVEMPSGTAACVDAPTMAIINQLRATGADVPALLAANKDALISGLKDLKPTDPSTTAWRDALVDDLESDNLTAAAAEIAKLATNEVTLTPC